MLIVGTAQGWINEKIALRVRVSFCYDDENGTWTIEKAMIASHIIDFKVDYDLVTGMAQKACEFLHMC